MAKQYRVGAFVRFNNAFMRTVLRTGVRFGTFAIRIVPGRPRAFRDSSCGCIAGSRCCRTSMFEWTPR